MSTPFDITKFCQKSQCMNLIMYNKLQTGGNNPHITKRARFAQIIQNRRSCNKSGSCKLVVTPNDYYTQFPYRPATI